jgi:hypothetical protein
MNEFLPNELTDETAVYTSLEFNEVSDEEVRASLSSAFLGRRWTHILYMSF